MAIEEHQVVGGHTYESIRDQSRILWNMIKYQCPEQDILDMNIVKIIAERDAAIEERNQALIERRKALDERRVALAQRNLAIREHNDAVLERDNAYSALQQSMNEPIIYERACNPINQVQASFEQDCPSARPRKRKRNGEGVQKTIVELKNVWNAENLGLNKIDFDESIMPIPGCSCTGSFRQCYKWGIGGWQSCCCTTTISAFPLPRMPNKRSGRLCGRKMTGSVFSKLLTRLAMDGFDFTCPVDLKEHWSKHGTNRYVTIK